MPNELKILLIYCLLVILMLVIQSILAVRQHGVRPLVGSRDGLVFTGAADRAVRAVSNTLISLVLIIPPVFTLALLSVSTFETIVVLQIFIAAEFCTLSFICLGLHDQELPVVDGLTMHIIRLRFMFGSCPDLAFENFSNKTYEIIPFVLGAYAYNNIFSNLLLFSYKSRLIA